MPFCDDSDKWNHLLMYNPNLHHGNRYAAAFTEAERNRTLLKESDKILVREETFLPFLRYTNYTLRKISVLSKITII